MALKSKAKKKPEEPGKTKRKFFRIEYPVNHRSKFVHKIGKFPIFDLSEGGLSFEVDPAHTFLETEKVDAEIHFVSGSTQKIRGKVIRVVGRKIIIQFISGVTLKQIMEEERYLVQRHLLKAN